MKRNYIWLIVIGALVFYAFVIYNNIISARNEVERAWADVESTYQRRFELIPNLGKVVKKYATYEQETFIKVTEARNRVKSLDVNLDNLNADKLQQYQQAQSALQKSMAGVIDVVVERYPDLKANENFLNLQTELAGTENRINTARQRYNQAVKTYNTKIQRFPGLLYARQFGFEEKPLFDAVEGASEVPDIDEVL